MSQGQQKLPFIPDIEPILPKPKSRDGAVIDSLRFSYDLDYDNTLEYSEDGREINFEFEDYPENEEYQFGGKHHNRNLLSQDVLKGIDVKKEEDKNETMDQSVNRKLEIFQKYRNKNKAKEQQAQTNKGTDIVDSFDRIFNMKGDQPHQSTQFSFKKKIHQSNINSSQPSSTLQQPQNKSASQTVIENKAIQPSLVTPALSQPKNSLQFTFSSPVDSINNPNGNAQTNQINNQNEIKQNSNFVLGNEQKSISNDTPINSLNTSFNSSKPANEVSNKIYFDYSQVSDVSNKSFTNQQSSYNELSISNVSNPNQIINSSIVSNFQLKQQISINNNRPSIDIVQEQIKPNSDPMIPSFVKHHSNQVFEFSPTQPENKAHSLHDIGLVPAPIQGFDSRVVNSNMTGSARLAQPIFDEQNRIAPLFKKIHKMNSIYPNFNHPNLNLDQQSKFCNILAQIFLQAFLILQNLALRALDRLKQPKYYPIQLSSLSYFLNSKWQVQHYKEWQLLNSTIKPQSNFPRKEIKEVKIKDALVNYKDVIVYYKERKIYLNNEEGIKSYFRIRQKFWALQRNMRSMSEDIYRIYQENQYPFFYFDYLNMLRAPLPAKNDERTIKYHQNVLKILIINRQRMEPLSCSEVGLAVKAKLERELKFLCPF